MAFVVIYDACVLYPAPLRDLLIRVARTGVVRARWSAMILDECFANILEQRPDLSAAQLSRTRELMVRAVPDCMVEGFEDLIAGLSLPDADDRHVLAAAIRASAQTIVTFNLKDFPAEPLTPYEIEAQHPDDFLFDLLDLAPGAVLSAVNAQLAGLKNPPQTMSQLLDTLRSQGLAQSVARLRELLGILP
ncbi:MAG: PIN domain-containing protein [Myxococcales bacterium]|nr:PIN domain-containing protein [Myxococcales bacterium]